MEAPAPTVPPSLPVRLGTRLWFGWVALLAVVATPVAALLQVTTHQVNPTARNFKRWAGWWGRCILRGAGVRPVVAQRAPLDPAQPYLFVANHQNAYDILALADALPLPFGFVAKAELRKVPALGFAVAQSASVFLDRSHPKRSLESIQEAGARIRAGNSVLIFPEGARSYTPYLLPFKKGAFLLAVEAGVPLVPVTIVDAYRRVDERHHVARPGRIHLVVGTPIPTAGLRRRDVPGLVRAVYAQIDAELAAHRQALGLPAPEGAPLVEEAL